MPALPSIVSEAGAVRAVGAALSLVMHRYGAPATVELRGADGSLVPLDPPSAPDDERLGDLLQRGGRGDHEPVCAIATLRLDDRAPPLELTFTGSTAHAAGGDAGGLVTAASVKAHVDALLAAAVADPGARFADVDIVGDADRRRLMRDFNGSRSEYPATTLHALFREQARRTPDAVALVDGPDAVSYRELDEASDRVAHALRPQLRAAGRPVAVVGPRSADTMAVKVAVMKAGGAFVYLDPALPASRAATICAIADPAVVIASASAPAPRASAPLLLMEELLLGDAAPATPPDEIAGESTAAYVLFTSGSTGEPKGVVRPHRMNTTRIFLEQRLYGLGPSDRHLLKSVPFHRETFLGLATGGTLVIARPGGERDDAYLVDLMRRERITVASFVPSMLRVLLTHPGFRAGDLALRHLFVAGEVFDAELEAALRARGFAVHVTYTLAEADYVTHRGGPLAPGERATVGRPIDMRVYLCDPDGRLRPPGLVGEILTGGPGLADGYVNRPELTDERFVANPFGDDAAPVLFRTGDLGRWRADGQLEFAGRTDGQVKVRGQRVEPTEVEVALRRHDSVRDVVVTGIPDAAQGHVLAAYVAVDGGEAAVPALRAFLSAQLPAHMVPAYIVPVNSLALLGSGKVDRAGLQTTLRERSPGIGPPVQPADDLERRVADVWKVVLGLDEVGVEDAFTDLGGDSLRAMLLRSALESELGRPVALATLMRSPTVRDLCDELGQLEVSR